MSLNEVRMLCSRRMLHLVACVAGQVSFSKHIAPHGFPYD